MPKKIINTAVMKKILFAPLKNSLEKSFPLLTDKIFDKFLTKSIIGPVIKNADIPSTVSYTHLTLPTIVCV